MSDYRFHNQGWWYLAEEGFGPFFRNAQGIAHQGLDPRYMTDSNGNYARLRVDVGQTGFFAGREFMTFYEFSIPQGGTRTMKAVAGVDVYLQAFSADCWSGTLRVELYAGGTDTAPFTIALPSLRTNGTASIDASYSSHVTMAATGSHTGGTLVDVMQLNSGNKGNSVEGGSSDPIGFPIGTYYIKLINLANQDTTGVFKARWEERP